MNEMISVVIPVYKVEKYLPECLDSVIAQTYENMEIILVDDGSPDNCGAICDRYAGKDQRIKCIHKKENGGLAEARNTGMAMASGEYLLFIDSDDWLSRDALEKLYEGLKRYHVDCCVGVCVMVQEKENGERKVQRGQRRTEKCKTAREAVEQVLLTGSSACNRLYRRKMLEGLRFPPGRINEDEPFVLRVYERMDKIAFLDCESYFYRKRANSITTSDFSVKMMDCVYNSRDNIEFVRQKMPELLPAAEYKYCKGMLWCYVNLRKLSKDRMAKTLAGQLHQEIRRNWKMALYNPHMELWLKALTLICLI